jgi:hypothetical protein
MMSSTIASALSRILGTTVVAIGFIAAGSYDAASAYCFSCQADGGGGAVCNETSGGTNGLCVDAGSYCLMYHDCS